MVRLNASVQGKNGYAKAVAEIISSFSRQDSPQQNPNQLVPGQTGYTLSVAAWLCVQQNQAINRSNNNNNRYVGNNK